VRRKRGREAVFWHIYECACIRMYEMNLSIHYMVGQKKKKLRKKKVLKSGRSFGVCTQEFTREKVSALIHFREPPTNIHTQV